MWTTENRAQYDRSTLRYPSDLTNAEWALIKPLIPPAKRGGNKRTVDEREIINGLTYILSTGCQWAAPPKYLPPRSTVNAYFRRWDYDGTLDRIHQTLYVKCREWAERQPSPTDAIMDIQSVESAGKGGAALIRRVITPARKIEGKKQHILVDTQVLLLLAIVHAADIQDRDSGVLLMRMLFGQFPFLLKLYADSGYQGPVFQQGLARVAGNQRRNRQALRRWQVCGAAEALNRRANNRLVEQVPSPGQGLGMPQPQRFDIPALGIRPRNDAKALPSHDMIVDRL
jgi:transposase